MSKALFADLAEQFISVAVKTWVIRSKLPAAAAADVLLTTAIQQGFLEDRGRPLLGNTLNEWGRNKKYPRWAGPYRALWFSFWLMGGNSSPILNGLPMRLYTFSLKRGERSPNSSMFCRKGWTLMWRQVGSAQRRKTLPDIMRGKSCDDVF